MALRTAGGVGVHCLGLRLFAVCDCGLGGDGGWLADVAQTITCCLLTRGGGGQGVGGKGGVAGQGAR